LRPRAPLTVTILNRPAVPGPVQTEFVEVKSVVTAHARAVLGNETVDIESHDPADLAHWFVGKIQYPVVVPDLRDHRFSLNGGRIDYLEDRAVATLAVDRDESTISLYIMPQSDAEAVRGNRNGYSVVGWEDVGLAYFAVSDLDRKVLDELQDTVNEANERRRTMLPKTHDDGDENRAAQMPSSAPSGTGATRNATIMPNDHSGDSHD